MTKSEALKILRHIQDECASHEANECGFCPFCNHCKWNDIWSKNPVNWELDVIEDEPEDISVKSHTISL